MVVISGKVRKIWPNIIRNIKICAIHRNTRTIYVVHVIYPGRPFLHSPQSRPAGMKFQAGTFSSSRLVYSTKPMILYPAYTPHTKQGNISTPANAGNFCCPLGNNLLNHPWDSFLSFYCSPPPNKSNIVLSSPTIFSSSRFSAELSRH